MPSISRLIERMRYWCEEVSLGYSQGPKRWNIYPGGETDCSALVIHCLQEAGFDTGSAKSTADLSDQLVPRGWRRMPVNGHPEAGDLLLNDGLHVAVYLGGGKLAEASLNEFGGLTGGTPGDQTGHETHVTNYYNRPWKCYLRYTDYLEGFDNMTADEVRAIMCGGGILVRDRSGQDTGIHTDLSNEAAWNRTNFERIYERLDRIEELLSKK